MKPGIANQSSPQSPVVTMQPCSLSGCLASVLCCKEVKNTAIHPETQGCCASWNCFSSVTSLPSRVCSAVAAYCAGCCNTRYKELNEEVFFSVEREDSEGSEECVIYSVTSSRGKALFQHCDDEDIDSGDKVALISK